MNISNMGYSRGDERIRSQFLNGDHLGFSILYFKTIILQARIEYVVVDSRRRAQHRVGYDHLYNNQISARALIGQSAMVYCASKLMEILRVF